MSLPLPHVDGVEHRRVDANGMQVHVAEAGAGPPLVLLHGWPQHWYAWRRLIPLLADEYHVICPDLRGLGWTDAPAGGYEKENLADDLLALLDALGHDRVRLVGHDWGGWIGFLAVLRAPERFERFLCVNVPPPWPRPTPASLIGLWRFWYQVVLASPGASRLLAARPEFVSWLIARDACHPDVWSRAELEAFSAPLREPARARASSQLYRSLLLRELRGVLLGRYQPASLVVPTHLLFGAADHFISTRLLRGVATGAPSLTVELVADCGHFLPEERPELLARRARELFA